MEAHDGSWWLVFLGIRKRGGHPGWHHLGRETFLAPVEWIDGWPVVNGGDPIEETMSVTDTDLERDDRAEWTTQEPFDGDRLGPKWNYRFSVGDDRIVLEDGTLALSGGPATLDDRESTFVGRRQHQLECRVETETKFSPKVRGGRIDGALRRISPLRARRRSPGEDRRAIVRATVGGVSDVLAETAVPEGPVTLSIDATADEYRFAVDPVERSEHVLATMPTKYLSTEVAGGFTGTYVGLYATGNGEPAPKPATFDSFTYRDADTRGTN